MDSDISHAVQDELDALSARIAVLEAKFAETDDPGYGVDEDGPGIFPEVAPEEE